MAEIKGRVVDYNTDNPIPNVLVSGVNKDGAVFASGNTDSEGKFDLNHTGFDDLYSTIRFQKDGYGLQQMQPASANNADVVLSPTGTLAAFTLTVKKNPTKVIIAVIITAALVFLYFKYKNKLKL
jgi:hypothetical protein